MDLGGDSPFFELEYWNFQHMLDLWFREASQNLSSYRQLFFHSFQGGNKGKMLKNCQNYTLVFRDGGNYFIFILFYSEKQWVNPFILLGNSFILIFLFRVLWTSFILCDIQMREMNCNPALVRLSAS